MIKNKLLQEIKDSEGTPLPHARRQSKFLKFSI